MDLIHIIEWLHNDIPDNYFIEKVTKWYDTDSSVIKHLIPEKTENMIPEMAVHLKP